MKYVQASSLTANDKIQLALVAVTFLAVLVALFGEWLWKQVEKPKIKVDFDRSSERCFRWATNGGDTIQEEVRTYNTKRYYFRLRVHNHGMSAARNLRVRAEIRDKNKKLVDRFEPTELNWITGAAKVDLARDESEYVNILSQLVNCPTVNNRVRVEIANPSPRGIAWDRPLATYIFEVTVYGDNIVPVQTSFKFRPKKDISKPGILELA